MSKRGKYSNCSRHRTVYKYDLYGKLIAEYTDLETAAKEEKVSMESIRQILIGNHKVSKKGFVYRWALNE